MNYSSDTWIQNVFKLAVSENESLRTFRTVKLRPQKISKRNKKASNIVIFKGREKINVVSGGRINRAQFSQCVMT